LYVCEYYATHYVPPTIREIMAQLGLDSTSYTLFLLHKLEGDGLLRSTHGGKFVPAGAMLSIPTLLGDARGDTNYPAIFAETASALLEFYRPRRPRRHVYWGIRLSRSPADMINLAQEIVRIAGEEIAEAEARHHLHTGDT
jgi:hypothetical protein